MNKPLEELGFVEALRLLNVEIELEDFSARFGGTRRTIPTPQTLMLQNRPAAIVHDWRKGFDATRICRKYGVSRATFYRVIGTIGAGKKVA